MRFERLNSYLMAVNLTLPMRTRYVFQLKSSNQLMANNS